jgi:arginine N-succinyltransferase
MSFRVRPSHPDDLQAIYEMAKLTGGGFTNLPADRGALAAKLARSAEAFAKAEEEPGDDLYMFVLENADSGQIGGTAQIFAKIGQHWPFYSYRIGTLSQSSRELGRSFRAEMLTLTTDLEGSTEVGGLFLHPRDRAGGFGLLLARSRYLFIARHRARFADTILAELRGVIDEAGGSPFWDGVAGKFFGMSFQEADQFNAVHGNQFIADLMPKHPVYIAMLNEHARSVIGVPHPTGRAAMRMLENEGFAFENYVDIFDGGPTMTARTDQVASVRDAKHVEVTGILEGGEDALIATGRLGDFRCCFGKAGAGGTIDAETARILGVGKGDAISWIGR